MKTTKRTEYTPATVIASTFIIVIAIGAALLTLPISSKSGQFTGILDCIFTATTSTCVTGLVTVDTFSHWSGFGHTVILLMIQIGGIGLVTITTFFFMMFRRRIGYKELLMITEAVNTGTVARLRSLIRLVVTFTLIIEALGAAVISLRLINSYGYTVKQGILTGIFTSVSAYCNAGIDLFGRPESRFQSLVGFRDDPVMNFAIMGLIILGGLGFIVYHDLMNYRKNKKLMLHTKVVLLSTAILIFAGFVFILFFEWTNPKTLGGLSLPQKLMSALFQSVTTRTAGFNTISMDGMRDPTKLLFCIWMFIGAAPGSTAGGIKVTTFFILISVVVSTLKNHNDTLILGRKINPAVVYKAFSISLLGIIVPCIVTTIIFVTEKNIPFISCAFESFSAIGTVGLTTGITPSLCKISKIALILTMFIGRIGPFSFFMALFIRQKKKKFTEVFPDGQIMVG